jgi:LEA14-like dessication related protein
VALLLAVLALAAAPSAPIGLVIRPAGADAFTAVVVGPAPGEATGDFSGTVAVNGSAELPVKGLAHRATDGRLELSLNIRYADIPADWAERFHLGNLDFRLHGAVGRRERVDWSGTLPWRDVSVDGEKDAVSRFVQLSTLKLTHFSILESEARASVVVHNPFAFPLKVATAVYRLLANGYEVGAGETRGFLLHAGKDNVLDFPIDIEHAQLLAAAGSALASGGEVEGRLRGELRVRLPGGDVAVPLDLAGKLDLLSE